jgi:hypothetical protein
MTDEELFNEFADTNPDLGPRMDPNRAGNGLQLKPSLSAVCTSGGSESRHLWRTCRRTTRHDYPRLRMIACVAFGVPTCSTHSHPSDTKSNPSNKLSPRPSRTGETVFLGYQSPLP